MLNLPNSAEQSRKTPIHLGNSWAICAGFVLVGASLMMLNVTAHIKKSRQTSKNQTLSERARFIYGMLNRPQFPKIGR
jgi:hypothetical protein